MQLRLSASQTAQFTSRLCTLSAKRPQICIAIQKNGSTIEFRRRATMDTKFDKIDIKHEKEIAKQKMPATPDTVSATSSIHPILGEVGVKDEEKQSGHAGIAADIVRSSMIRLTINLLTDSHRELSRILSLSQMCLKKLWCSASQESCLTWERPSQQWESHSRSITPTSMAMATSCTLKLQSIFSISSSHSKLDTAQLYVCAMNIQSMDKTHRPHTDQHHRSSPS